MGKQTQASKKYNEAHYDEVRFRVKKGELQRYKDEAEKRGFSLAQFIRNAIEMYIDEYPEL